MSTLSDKNREKVEETLLKSISVKCIECDGKMIRTYDKCDHKNCSACQGLDDGTVIGYRCQDCPHYNLFDNYPV